MTISTFGTRLVAGAAMAALLGAATACGSAVQPTSTHSTGSPHSVVSQSGATGAGTTAFSFGGFSLVLPADWHSTTSRCSDDGAVCLTAASSPVQAGDGGLGMGSLGNLGPDDVLVCINEYVAPYVKTEAAWPVMTSPPQVDRSQIAGYEGVPWPVSMIIEGHQASGRYFQVGVAFGRQTPTDAQIALANQVLATLTVALAPSG